MFELSGGSWWGSKGRGGGTLDPDGVGGQVSFPRGEI